MFDRTRARAAFKTGSQHYNLGEFDQALASFREAYRYVDDPSFLFNIAQCERQLADPNIVVARRVERIRRA